MKTLIREPRDEYGQKRKSVRQLHSNKKAKIKSLISSTVMCYLLSSPISYQSIIPHEILLKYFLPFCKMCVNKLEISFG